MAFNVLAAAAHNPFWGYIPIIIIVVGLCVAIFLIMVKRKKHKKQANNLLIEEQRLINLQKLHDEGILTEEEFQTQKDKILGGK